MIPFAEMCDRILICKDCDLHLYRRRAVCGHGSPESDLLFIGEAPGRTEEMEGSPFVGRSGKLIDSVLRDAGIGREEIYITNAVKCRPKNGASPRIGEIRKCSPYLRQEIEMVKPRIIVPMGNSALRALGLVLNQRFPKISEIAGKRIHLQGYEVVPQYHPAAILRNPKKMESFKLNFLSVSRILRELGPRSQT